MLQLQTLATTFSPFPPVQSPSTSQSRRPPRMLPLAASAAEVSAAAASKSLYEVLRVKRNASQVEIKTAYRTLAKLYHPDATARFMDSTTVANSSSSSDGRDFIEINDAYATLSDPDARAVYDFKLTVDSQRRFHSGYMSSGRGRFHPTRRWETDQCW